MQRTITELIGTFFLVLVIALAVQQDALTAAIAIGIGLAALVYLGGHISGAHYNPAVTIAFLLRGTFPRREVLPYIAGQLFAGLVAAATARLLTGSIFVPAPGGHWLAALLAETLFTFMLVLVILQVATHKRLAGNPFYGFAIGGTVLAAVIVVGPISGAVLNPAVAVGPMLLDLLAGGDSIRHLWIYIAGPLLGAMAAVIAFRLQGGSA